jgi:hypothetical protein
MTPSNSAATAGTDCNDTYDYYAPWVAYNEVDPSLCMRDYDGDGYGSDNNWVTGGENGTDCNDSSDTEYPGAAYMEDPVACMADDDMDGWGTMDCDDDNADLNLDDADNDGVTTCDMECDDTDGFPDVAFGVSNTDDDGDGYGPTEAYICDWDADSDGVDDYLYWGDDCNDTDVYTYPGAAYNDDAEACLTDADEDGYAPLAPTNTVFMLQLDESYGDGWNSGGHIAMYVDGVMVDSGLTSNSGGAPAGSFYLESGTQTGIFGPFDLTGTGAVLTVEYVSGAWDSENSFILTNMEAVEFLNGSGSSSDMTLLELPLIGSDADDADPNVNVQ